MQTPILFYDKLQLTGDVIATGISYEQFLNDFDGEHAEWINGVVIAMASIDERHDALSSFCQILFSAYLELTGGGRILRDPMVMRTLPELPVRAPDLQVLLPHNVHKLGRNEVVGAADLIVEIVSPSSHRRDRIEKFTEYEAAGVAEYWVLDPTRHESLFYGLNEHAKYELREPDADGIYKSIVLDRLSFRADLFWREPLPGVLETLRMVQSMLGQS